MGYVIAGMVIAIGITMIVAGLKGSGSELFQGLSGLTPSGNSSSASRYGNTGPAPAGPTAGLA